MHLECMLIRLHEEAGAALSKELRELGRLAMRLPGLRDIRAYTRAGNNWDLVVVIEWQKNTEQPSLFGQELASRMKNYGILEHVSLLELSLIAENPDV